MLNQTSKNGKSQEWKRTDLIEWARHTDTTPPQLAILKAIIDRVNLKPAQVEANSLAAWPSYDCLIADTHYCRRSVAAAVKALLQKGLIVLGTEPVYLPNKNYPIVPDTLIFILRPEVNEPLHEERGGQEMHPPRAGDAPPPVQEMHPPRAGDAPKVLREEKRKEVLREVVKPGTMKNVVPGPSLPDNFLLSVGDTLSAQGQSYDVTSPAGARPKTRQVGKILTVQEKREARLAEQDELEFRRWEEEEQAKAGRKSA